MTRIKFSKDFEMLESSNPQECCQTLFRLKIEYLLPPKWITFTNKNLYQRIRVNMVFNLSISTHTKYSLISDSLISD